MPLYEIRAEAYARACWQPLTADTEKFWRDMRSHVDKLRRVRGLDTDYYCKTCVVEVPVEPILQYIDAFLDALDRVEVPTEEWP